jgi:hypothetical protein
MEHAVNNNKKLHWSVFCLTKSYKIMLLDFFSFATQIQTKVRNDVLRSATAIAKGQCGRRQPDHSKYCCDIRNSFINQTSCTYKYMYIIQCVRKVAVHLEVWVAISIRRMVGPWTSLPTPFISAQRLSERSSPECVCE